MEPKVTVVCIDDNFEGVAPMCYRIDDAKNADFFAMYLRNNLERDEKYTFSIKEISKDEWEDMCKETEKHL